MEYTTNILKKVQKQRSIGCLMTSLDLGGHADCLRRMYVRSRLEVRALWDQVACDVLVQVRRKVCVHTFPRPSGNQV